MLDSSAVLAQAARIGPFFAWHTGTDIAVWPRVVPADGPASPPVPALIGPNELDAQVARIRQALATGAGTSPEAVEPRVAASILFVGWAARLVSAPLACAVLADAIPNCRDLRWQPASAPLELGLPAPALHISGSVDELAALVRAEVIDPVVVSLAHAIGDRFAVSPRVMTGNISSAVAGAAGQIAQARPDLHDRTVSIVNAVLAAEPLAGTGRFRGGDGATTSRAFRRNSCCLLYRVPGYALCGDCVLSDR